MQTSHLRQLRLVPQCGGRRFTSPNKKWTGRCTAVLTATTNVIGNVEPNTANNTTNLVIDVIDKSDF